MVLNRLKLDYKCVQWFVALLLRLGLIPTEGTYSNVGITVHFRNIVKAWKDKYFVRCVS